MIIRTTPWLFKYIFPKTVNAIALFPVVLVRNSKLRDDKRLLVHEKIHHKQQLELLVIPFYLLYILEYTWLRVAGNGHDSAYRKISFEREAYIHDADPDYVEKRKAFAMWR